MRAKLDLPEERRIEHRLIDRGKLGEQRDLPHEPVWPKRLEFGETIEFEPTQLLLRHELVGVHREQVVGTHGDRGLPQFEDGPVDQLELTLWKVGRHVPIAAELNLPVGGGAVAERRAHAHESYRQVASVRGPRDRDVGVLQRRFVEEARRKRRAQGERRRVGALRLAPLCLVDTGAGAREITAVERHVVVPERQAMLRRHLPVETGEEQIVGYREREAADLLRRRICAVHPTNDIEEPRKRILGNQRSLLVFQTTQIEEHRRRGLLAAFARHEEVQPVTHQRATRATAVLIQRKLIGGPVDVVGRRQRLIPVKGEGRAFERIGAEFRGRGHRATTLPPLYNVVVIRRDFKFADGFDRHDGTAAGVGNARTVLTHGGAIHLKGRRCALGPAEIGAGRQRGDGGEIGKIPIGHRQCFDVVGRDQRARSHPLNPRVGGIRLHHEWRQLCRGESQPKRQRHPVVQREFDAGPLLGAVSNRTHRDQIWTSQRELTHGEAARRVRACLCFKSRGPVARRNGSVGNGTTSLVRDEAVDRGRRRLAVEHPGRKPRRQHRSDGNQSNGRAVKQRAEIHRRTPARTRVGSHERGSGEIGVAAEARETGWRERLEGALQWPNDS